MPPPNPFRDVGPWNTLRLGGVLVKPLLVEIDGVKTTDEWKDQKSKESSGKVWVFQGTTKDKPKLTLEAPDEESFDDLLRLWEQLKPVPGLGGVSAPTTSTASAPTTAVGSPPAPPVTAESLLAQAQAKLAALNNPSAASSTTGSSSSTAGAGAAAAATSNPGPRPPTVSVQNAILAFHGIFAVARGEWDGPKPTPTRSWKVVLTVIPQEPPTPAGTGAMAPVASGSQWAGGGSAGAAATGGAPTPQVGIQKNAAAGAAGT
jgi:hypothetical protein